MSVFTSNEKPRLSPPRIVCAAIQNHLGEIIVSARHYDPLMRKLITKDKEFCNVHRGLIKQGFIDQHNNFYTRTEAYRIAVINDQIIRPHPRNEFGELFSENLY